MAHLKDIHGWNFDVKSNNYICKYQIDNELPQPLSGHECITPAHYSNGNLGRCCKKLYGRKSAKERSPGVWVLYIEDHVIELTVNYINPQEIVPVFVDPSSIKHESDCSQRSEKLLNFLLQKLKSMSAIIP